MVDEDPRKIFTDRNGRSVYAPKPSLEGEGEALLKSLGRSRNVNLLEIKANFKAKSNMSLISVFCCC